MDGDVMKASAKTRWLRRAVFAMAALVTAGSAALAGPAIAAAGRQANAAGPARELAAGETGSRVSVPWSRIGPGWALAEYSAGTSGDGVPVRAGSDTLYLVDPAGGRYTLAGWPKNSAPTKWRLQAWSGDGKRALFVTFGTRQQVHQLDLRTGRLTGFTLPAGTNVLGYTRPDGLNILVGRGIAQSDSHVLERYSLAGRLQASLTTVADLGQVAYQPAGRELAAGALRGLELVSNRGGVIRTLKMRGESNGCNAVRWWSSNTILASCETQSYVQRMWLVPANGGTAKPLAPIHQHNFDLGDFNAWQLSSGLYLNGYGACGSMVIGKQPARGPETLVNVPGSASSLIVTATSSRLLVERINGCEPGNSLVWYNPATRAMNVAVPVHGHQQGVIAAIPYFVTGKF
jgi:hypothetical protein